MAQFRGASGKNNWTYRELIGKAAPGTSPQESFGPDDNRATKLLEFDDAWGSRQELVKDVLGWAEKGGGGKICRYGPMGHPDYTDGVVPTLWATRILNQYGVGVPDNGVMQQASIGGGVTVTSRYKHVRAQIQYESLLFNVASAPGGAVGAPRIIEQDESTWQRYIQIESQPAGQMVTLPKGNLRFVGPVYAGKTTDLYGVNIGKMLPQVELKVTWKNLPTNCVPSSTINPAAYPGADTDFTKAGPIERGLGKINNAGFNGYIAGQLLYLACTLRPIKSWYVNSGASRIWDVTFSFAFNPYLHARIPFLTSIAPPAIGWVEVTANGTTNLVAMADGQSIFDWFDMASLFRAPN